MTGMSKAIEPRGDVGVTPPASDRPTWGSRLVFLIAFLGLVASVALGLWKPGRAAEMGIAVGACLFTMAFTRLEKFKVLKGAGFELQMKEAEKVVREASATLEQLRDLAAVTSKISLDTLARSGVRTFQPVPEKLRLQGELVPVLQQIGVRPDEIAQATKTMDEVVRRQHALKIRRGAFAEVAAQTAKDTTRVNALFPLNEALEQLVPSNDIYAPPARVLRTCIADHKLTMTDGLEDLLRDYEHFETTGTLRRPEIWTRPAKSTDPDVDIDQVAHVQEPDVWT